MTRRRQSDSVVDVSALYLSNNSYWSTSALTEFMCAASMYRCIPGLPGDAVDVRMISHMNRYSTTGIYLYNIMHAIPTHQMQDLRISKMILCTTAAVHLQLPDDVGQVYRYISRMECKYNRPSAHYFTFVKSHEVYFAFLGFSSDFFAWRVGLWLAKDCYQTIWRQRA